MDLNVLYWEGGTTVLRTVDMGDTTTLDDDVLFPKIDILKMTFSHKVAGNDTTAYAKQEFDNYQVILDERTNISSMFGFDNDNGGWFRNQNPFAVDGYAKPSYYPGLFPYSRANYISWVFFGILLTQVEWDSTLAARQAMD